VAAYIDKAFPFQNGELFLPQGRNILLSNDARDKVLWEAPNKLSGLRSFPDGISHRRSTEFAFSIPALHQVLQFAQILCALLSDGAMNQAFGKTIRQRLVQRAHPFLALSL
jgi:hypothetical protein